jgi:hypothetical protein
MRISLKFWLIGICVFGALIGVMTRLMLENPEAFFNVMRMAVTVGPFALAVGTVMWFGRRGATPSRGLVLWGGMLALTPIIGFLAMALLMPTGSPLSILSTQRLISQQLPKQADQPWVWHELERRLSDGDLTKAEVDDAIAEYAGYMKRTKPAGWDQPLSWQRRFLEQAAQKRLISPKAQITLAEAFFGPAPTVKVTTPALTSDDTQFTFNIHYGSTWADHTGLGIGLIWNVKQVMLNGKPLKLRDVQKHWGREATITGESELTAGEHKLTVELDCALVDAARLNGLDLDNLPVEQWPKSRKQWVATATIPVQVMPPVTESNDAE